MLNKQWMFTLADAGKFLLVSPVIVLLAYCLFLLPWDAQAAPGWAQAVGSMLAIGAAVGIASRQRAHESELLRDHRYDEESAKLNGLFALESHMRGLLSRLDTFAKDENYRTFGFRDELAADLERVRDEYRDIGLTDFGSDYVDFVMKLKKQAEFCGECGPKVKHRAVVDFTVFGAQVCKRLEPLNRVKVALLIREKNLERRFGRARKTDALD